MDTSNLDTTTRWQCSDGYQFAQGVQHNANRGHTTENYALWGCTTCPLNEYRLSGGRFTTASPAADYECLPCPFGAKCQSIVPQVQPDHFGSTPNG